MINFKFAWVQFKKIKFLLLVIFFIFLIVLLLPALLVDNFTSSSVQITHTLPDGSVELSGMVAKVGAIFFLKWSYFSFPGFILMFVMNLTLSYVLVSREVEKGYIVSWLCLPMSRRTILNSKLFLLLISIFSLYFLAFIFQLIAFSIRFHDFGVKIFSLLVLGNFAFIILALLWASINWFFITSLKKEINGLMIAVLISVLFLLFHILDFISETDKNLEYLKSFKSLTIISFFNFPSDIHVSDLYTTIVSDESPNLLHKTFMQAKRYIWQIPLMLGVTAGLFYLGNYFFIKKDLSL